MVLDRAARQWNASSGRQQYRVRSPRVQQASARGEIVVSVQDEYHPSSPSLLAPRNGNDPGHGPVFQLAPRDTKWRRLDGFRDLSIGEAMEKCTSSEPVVLSVGSGPAVFALASEARAFGLTVAVGPAEELQFD